MSNENQQEGELSLDAQLHSYQDEIVQFENDYQSILGNTRLEHSEKATAIVTLITRMRKVSTKLRALMEAVPVEQKESVEKVLADVQQLRVTIINQV